jgi:hypothetical protein
MNTRNVKQVQFGSVQVHWERESKKRGWETNMLKYFMHMYENRTMKSVEFFPRRE